jgi:hypothetical protein
MTKGISTIWEISTLQIKQTNKFPSLINEFCDAIKVTIIMMFGYKKIK